MGYRCRPPGYYRAWLHLICILAVIGCAIELGASIIRLFTGD